MRKRILLVALLFCFWSVPALGHHPEHKDVGKEWFESQMQEGVSALCCGDLDVRGGDAHFVDVVKIGNEYYLRIDGEPELIRYPLRVNPNHPNPFDRGIAWYKREGDGYKFFCLRLAPKPAS